MLYCTMYMVLHRLLLVNKNKSSVVKQFDRSGWDIGWVNTWGQRPAWGEGGSGGFTIVLYNSVYTVERSGKVKSKLI